jgi:HAD domain in Swiss Army Knife RNA repair proteins
MMVDPKRPIVFLDIDGVLNSLASTLGSKPNAFDHTACKLMERLVVQANAQVVISSSWREGRTPGQLINILWEQAQIHLLAARVVGVTPILAAGNRGDEIARWITDHSGQNNAAFVIIDDEFHFNPDQIPHLVQTSHRDGFTVKNYLAALKIIAPDHPDNENLKSFTQDEVPGIAAVPESEGSLLRNGWDVAEEARR